MWVVWVSLLLSYVQGHQHGGWEPTSQAYRFNQNVHSQHRPASASCDWSEDLSSSHCVLVVGGNHCQRSCYGDIACHSQQPQPSHVGCSEHGISKYYSKTFRQFTLIIIIIITRTILIVLSLWPQCHCESSLSLFDECTTAPNGRRPSDQATLLGLWVHL